MGQAGLFCACGIFSSKCLNGPEWPVIEVKLRIPRGPHSPPKSTMNDSAQRAIQRWIHLVFSIPIVGYIYSPFKELPNYAPMVRYLAVPVIVFSGLWMWKGRALRRSVAKELA